MELDKLPKLLAEIEKSLVLERIPITRWRIFEGWLEPDELTRVNIESLPEVELPCAWGGYDATAWFFAEVPTDTIRRWDAAELHLEVGEALVYLNGKPWAGTDVNHQDLWLGAVERGTRLQFAIEAYNGLRAEKALFRSAELRIVDRELASALYDLQAAAETLEVVSNRPSDRLQLERALRKALRGIDPRTPGSEEWRASILVVAESLRNELTGARHHTPGHFWPVGHSHIDVAWLWRIKEVKRKCGRTFSTALRLMEEFPSFLFVQSQPALYEFVKERYPTLFEEIRQRVKEGRWQPVGAMWVEADCNISSGEALVRQILYGKRFFEREFGVSVRTLWLPDVFGYSWALPQILRKAEIEGFFTAKIGWNKQNPFPYSSFWWRGVDGSEILAHLSFHPRLYNIQLTPRDVAEAWERFRNKQESPHLLLPFGHGDGGGGPTRAHAANLRRLEWLPSLPEPRLDGVEEFFQTLRSDSGRLPTWDDELYFEYHRGVYTTQARVKRANRKAELALRDAEILAALAMQSGFAYPKDRLDEAWKLLLTNQFHDILPGSSIPEVYDDALRDLDRVMTIAGEVQEQALEVLIPETEPDALTVVNTLSWTRTDVVQVRWPVPNGKRIMFVDEAGGEVPVQILERHGEEATLLLLARNVPPLGSATYWAKITDEAETSQPDLDSVFETAHYRAMVNEKGELVSLVEKASELEILTGPGNVFETFVDFPHAWEAWDIDEDYVDHPLPGAEAVSQAVLSYGPVATVIETELRLGRSTIRQRMFLYRDLRRIDFDTRVDWHERRTLLKVRFPVNVRTRKATYEIQFGAIERSTHRNTSWQRAQYEVPAQRWADLGDEHHGLALMNDCKYGYDARDNVLRLTLLRSAYPPDPNEPAYRTQWDRPTDQGEHRFVYSILPHPGRWTNAHVPEAAYELNVPLKVLPGRRGQLRNLFIVEPEAPVIVEAVKRAEDSDDLIVRLYESEGKHAHLRLRLGCPIRGAYETNLLERRDQSLACRDDQIDLAFRPFELKTLRIQLK